MMRIVIYTFVGIFAAIGLGGALGWLCFAIVRKVRGTKEAQLFRKWKRLERQYKAKYGADV
jgi:hypothetical protein